MNLTRNPLLRLDEVLAATRLSKSFLYEQQQRGTFPRAVRLGGRAVAWPAREVDAVIAARIAGKSDDEVRVLVREIELRRASAMDA